MDFNKTDLSPEFSCYCLVWSGLGWTCLMLLVPVAILVHLIRSHLIVSRKVSIVDFTVLCKK